MSIPWRFQRFWWWSQCTWLCPQSSPSHHRTSWWPRRASTARTFSANHHAHTLRNDPPTNFNKMSDLPVCLLATTIDKMLLDGLTAIWILQVCKACFKNCLTEVHNSNSEWKFYFNNQPQSQRTTFTLHQSVKTLKTKKYFLYSPTYPTPKLLAPDLILLWRVYSLSLITHEQGFIRLTIDSGHIWLDQDITCPLSHPTPTKFNRPFDQFKANIVGHFKM